MPSKTSWLGLVAKRASVVSASLLAFALIAVLAAPSAEAARHRKQGQHQGSAHNQNRSLTAATRAPYYGRHLPTNRQARAHSRRNVRVASLGTDTYTHSHGHRPSRSVASGGGNVIWSASAGCLNGTLRSIVREVSSISSVRVNSTCRDHAHNRSVGGAKKSWHLSGDAVDFRVTGGNVGKVYAYLRSNSSIGGLKHYGGGLFHVDTGPRRSW